MKTLIITLLSLYCSGLATNSIDSNQQLYLGNSIDTQSNASENPLLGIAFRWLAKSFIKKTLKKQVRKNVRSNVGRFGLNQVADYAVDSAFDYLNSDLTYDEKNHIYQNWYTDNSSEYHFDSCPLCSRVGNTLLRQADQPLSYQQPRYSPRQFARPYYYSCPRR